MPNFTDHRDIKWPGAWLVEQEIVESVPEIPYNRTMFVQQLTDEAPDEPEFVKDCQNMKDVFQKFKPGKEVEFEDEDGVPFTEELKFNTLLDFGKEGIIKQSEALQEIQLKQETYNDFIKRLRSITILQKLLGDADAKTAYLGALEQAIAELEEIEPEEV